MRSRSQAERLAFCGRSQSSSQYRMATKRPRGGREGGREEGREERRVVIRHQIVGFGGREGGREEGPYVPYINQGPHLSVIAFGHFLSL